jgi:Spx/MgsR family transcriptional regulator
MLTLSGLKNCDSCRKAAAWLKAHQREFVFHDLRIDGLESARLLKWDAQIGWESLLNRKSTTWRGLAESDKTDLGRVKALDLMLTHPALIKRPLLEVGEDVWLGFTPERYSELP